MEKILYFDCFAGISGDMSMAALVDLGLDSKTVIEEISKLGVTGYHIEITKTEGFSIGGTDVKVTVDQGHMSNHNHSHSHSHSHSHGNGHEHSHKERSLIDIVEIIEASSITENAKDLSIKIFTEIAKAEAVVHNKSLEEVHFHEVGAIDSIVDIVGTAICIDMLKVDKIYCSPVHEGQGFIHCRHGKLPVPVPAVVQMLKGSNISIITEDINAELVTPTGFGILKSIVDECRKMPEIFVEKIGYGFGKTQTGSLNALRVILGTRPGQTSKEKEDSVTILETNIDDTSGEILGYTMEKLFQEGALDVFYTPIQMKKNRPAVMLSVICANNHADKLSKVIFSETSTIGIRMRRTQRITLDREIKTINTELGEVRVKSFGVPGLEKIQPEYDDCVRVAKENNLSLNEVYEIVKRRPE